MSRMLLKETPLIPRYKTVKYKYDVTLDEKNNDLKELISIYEEEYSVADMVSKVIYETGKINLTLCDLELSEKFPNSSFKNWHIEFNYSEYSEINALTMKTYGENDSNVFLIITLPKFFDTFSKDEMIKHLTVIVFHKILDIYTSKLFINEKHDLDKNLNRSNDIMEIINKSNELLYDYVYSIYITYQYESRKFISQTMPIFRELFYKNDLTNEEMEDGIKNCEQYRVYSHIANNVIPTITKLSDEELEKEIIDPIKKDFKLDWNIEIIKDSLKIIEENAKQALSKIVNNAFIVSKIENKDE